MSEDTPINDNVMDPNFNYEVGPGLYLPKESHFDAKERIQDVLEVIRSSEGFAGSEDEKSVECVELFFKFASKLAELDNNGTAAFASEFHSFLPTVAGNKTKSFVEFNAHIGELVSSIDTNMTIVWLLVCGVIDFEETVEIDVDEETETTTTTYIQTEAHLN